MIINGVSLFMICYVITNVENDYLLHYLMLFSSMFLFDHSSDQEK